MLKLGRVPGRVSLLAVAIVAVLATGTWFAMNHGQVKQTLLSSQSPSGGSTHKAAATVFGKETIFDFARHRRIEHYGRITSQTGVILPPEV